MNNEMLNRRVEMAFVRAHFTPALVADAHMRVIDGKWWYRWLQRLGWWIVTKSKARKQFYRSHETIKQIDFNPSSVLQAIMDGQHALMESIAYRGSPSMVLIGPDELSELMGDESAGDVMRTHPWHKDEQGWLRIGFGRDPRDGHMPPHVKFYGLKIRMVPHMKGVLLL